MFSTHVREWPPVSVIMPVLDEERHLSAAVTRVLDQDYPGDLELVLALGPSRDRTAEVAATLAARDPRLRLIDNPAGRTPNGLNAAIDAARHGIIVRVDGHGLLSQEYVRRAVQVLEDTGAANVGGAAGAADSVYLGVFRREVLERLGGYDEHFARAQDWELNYRIRNAGETVWFTPDLVVTYRPRGNLAALAKQFFGSGQWRREIVRRHPGTVSPRYLAAPVATASVGLGTAAGLAAALGGPGWLAAGWVVPAVYIAGAIGVGLIEGRELPWRARAWLPAVLAVMHLTWGAGFIVGSRHGVSTDSSVSATLEQS